VILATALLEKLHTYYPDTKLDILIRKGNEGLFLNHPYIHHIWIWDKKKDKLKSQIHIIRSIRKQHYDLVINCQRYFSSGIFTILSGAKRTVGFKPNPLSIFFTTSIEHSFDGKHEIERNQALIVNITDNTPAYPKLYIKNEIEFIKNEYFKRKSVNATHNFSYITISPSSVWFTKQHAAEKWIEFIDTLPADITVFLMGAPTDHAYNQRLMAQTKKNKNIINTAGELTLLQSAALMKFAKMNYVNDSASMHLCSATNAPTTVVYCSTIPEFGFGPLSESKFIIQTQKKLSCRPCGIHGRKECPQKHFECSYSIDTNQLTQTLSAV
jgi:heptosyltransferase-2